MPIDADCQARVQRIVAEIKKHVQEIDVDIQSVHPDYMPGWGASVADRSLQNLKEIEAVDMDELARALNLCRT